MFGDERDFYGSLFISRKDRRRKWQLAESFTLTAGTYPILQLWLSCSESKPQLEKSIVKQACSTTNQDVDKVLVSFRAQISCYAAKGSVVAA